MSPHSPPVARKREKRWRHMILKMEESWDVTLDERVTELLRVSPGFVRGQGEDPVGPTD